MEEVVVLQTELLQQLETRFRALRHGHRRRVIEAHDRRGLNLDELRVELTGLLSRWKSAAGLYWIAASDI